MSSDPSGRKGYGRIAPSSVCVRLHIRHHKPVGIRYTASVLGRMREVPMRDERLEVSVTFVPAKGYVASAPELRQPVVAVSLGGLRRRIEALMLPDNVNVRLILDRTAERERNRRRQQAQLARRASVLPRGNGGRGLTWPEGLSRRVRRKTPTTRGSSPRTRRGVAPSRPRAAHRAAPASSYAGAVRLSRCLSRGRTHGLGQPFAARP